ncbi:MAG: helix-turn-helix domain-containing protein [Silanimonas sp.]
MADQNHGIAARLRAARQQQGLGIDELARELKNPRAVLEAIERSDWARLGAPIFARHLVGRYASRLGVSVNLDEIVERVEAPVLRPQVSTSRMGRLADLSTRNAAYFGGSLLVLPLLYFALSQTASGPAEYRPLDPVPSAVVAPAPAVAATPVTGTGAADASMAPPDTAPVGGAVEGNVAAAPTLAGASAAVATPPLLNPTPVAASLAGVLPESPQLELRFSGDSWIEVFGRDGAVVERVLARDGDERRFAAGDVGRVTIGNVDATEVLLNGSRVNLDAVRAANVARFALSSDGSIEAVAR